MGIIQTSFKLPCGAELKNRLAKSAMTERLSQKDFKANQHHQNLYRKWGSDGTGLLLTGNMMVDPRYMESAGNITLDSDDKLDSLKLISKVSGEENVHIWPQIGHSGRQTTMFVNLRPVSASNVKLKKLGLFARPRPLSLSEIEGVIKRFTFAGKLCQKAGFTGIQIHGAHGYLISQFLSPYTNLRTDEYGGSLENRARLLINVIRGVRKEVGNHFPIGVKLNSTDFQKGGFSEDDSLEVVKMLENEGVDLLEISGGTYQKLAFFDGAKDSTKRREAYFLDFAKKVRGHSKIPLMVTGGFRSLEFCESVLSNNELDIIGMARPYLYHENFGDRFFKGERLEDPVLKMNTGIRSLNGMAEAGFYNHQIKLMARNKKLNPSEGAWSSLTRLVVLEATQGFRKKIVRNLGF